MFGGAHQGTLPGMRRFVLLHHSHRSDDCAVAFAAWRGFASPLRGETALASCLEGGHELWWVVAADSPAAALALLPPWVAERTHAVCVRKVATP